MRLAFVVAAALGLAIFGGGCSQSITDVCGCPTCSHPAGVCPGEGFVDAGAADATGDR